MPEKIKLPCSCRAVDPVPMERECGELATWFWQAYGGKLLRLLIKTTADNVYCGDGLSLATRLASIERTLGASTSMSFAANLAERDLLSRLNPGDRCYVFDASADPSIDEGGCMYMLMPDKSWKRLNEDARVDVEGLAGAGLAVSAEKLAVDWEKMPQETLAELLEQICGSGLAVADGLLAVRLASVSDADFCKKLEASIGRGLETGEDEDGRLALHVKLSDSVALADSETCASAVAVKKAYDRGQLGLTLAEANQGKIQDLLLAQSQTDAEAARIREIAESAQARAEEGVGLAEAAKAEAKQAREAAGEAQEQTAENAAAVAQIGQGLVDVASGCERMDSDLAKLKARVVTCEGGIVEVSNLAQANQSGLEQANNRLDGLTQAQEELAEDMAEVGSAANLAQELAEDAQELAESLEAQCQSANTKAEAAQSDAETAMATANNAQAAIVEVRATAQDALAQAGEAKATAQTAEEAASQAAEAAEESLANSETAAQAAELSLSNSVAAQEAAEQSLASVQNVAEVAENAQTTANNAKTTADGAKTTADAAKTAADAVQAAVENETTGLAATKAIADSAKTTAEAALPKAGGTITGGLTVNGNFYPKANQFMGSGSVLWSFDDNITLDALDEARMVYVVNDDWKYRFGMAVNSFATGLLQTRIIAQRPVGESSGVAVLALSVEADGTTYVLGSHPRDNYGLDLTTTKYVKDKFPQKLSSSLTIYVGGAGASDTADLFAGRGMTADMPFATLYAAMLWANNNLAGAGAIIFRLMADCEWNADNIFLPMGRLIYLQGDTASRRLTLKKPFVLVGGSLSISNLNLHGEVAATDKFIHCYGSASSIRLLFGSGVTFSGTAHTALFLQMGVQVYIQEDIGGDFAGVQYNISGCSRIIKGVRTIPGTAGVKDESSVVI